MIGVGERVKYLDVVANVRSAVQRTKAEAKEANGNVQGAKRLYAQTLQSVASALNSSPTDERLLLSMSALWLKANAGEREGGWGGGLLSQFLCQMHDMGEDAIALSSAERYANKGTCPPVRHVLVEPSSLLSVLELMPTSAEALVALSAIKERSGSLEEAEEHLLAALQLRATPDDLRRYITLLRKLKDDEAVKTFELHLIKAPAGWACLFALLTCSAPQLIGPDAVASAPHVEPFGGSVSKLLSRSLKLSRSSNNPK